MYYVFSVNFFLKIPRFLALKYKIDEYQFYRHNDKRTEVLQVLYTQK